MQDDRGKVHKSLSLQLARIAAEKASKRQVRQSVAGQILGPKSMYAQSDSPTQTVTPKPFAFGFSVLNELKKINVVKNPLSRPSSASKLLKNVNTRQSKPAAKGQAGGGSSNKHIGYLGKPR